MPPQLSENQDFSPFETLLFVRFLSTLGDARPENLKKAGEAFRRDEHVKTHRITRPNESSGQSQTANEANNDERLSSEALGKLYQDLLQEEENFQAQKLALQRQDGGPQGASATSASVSPPKTADFRATINSIVARLYSQYRERTIREIREDEEKFKKLSAEIKVLEEQEKEQQRQEHLQAQAPSKEDRPAAQAGQTGLGHQPMTPLQAQLAQAESLAASLGAQYPLPAQKQGTAITAAPPQAAQASQQPTDSRPQAPPTTVETSFSPHVPVSASQASTGQVLTPATGTTTANITPVPPLTTAPSQYQSPSFTAPPTTQAPIRGHAPIQPSPLRPPHTQAQASISPASAAPTTAGPSPPTYPIAAPQPRKVISRHPTPPQTHILQQALRESSVPQPWTVSTPSTAASAAKPLPTPIPKPIQQSQPQLQVQPQPPSPPPPPQPQAQPQAQLSPPQPPQPVSQPQQFIQDRPPPISAPQTSIPRPTFVSHQKPAQYKFQPPYVPAQPPPNAVVTHTSPPATTATLPQVALAPAPQNVPATQQQPPQAPPVQATAPPSVPSQPTSQSQPQPISESPVVPQNRLGPQTPSFLETFKRRPSRLSIHSSGSRTPWKAPSPIHTATIGSPVRPRPEDVSPITKEPDESLFPRLSDALEAAAAAAETSPTRARTRGEKRRASAIEEEVKEIASSPITAKKQTRRVKSEKSPATSPTRMSTRARSREVSILSADDESAADPGSVISQRTRRAAANRGRSPSAATATEESEVERRVSARLRATRQPSSEMKTEKDTTPTKTRSTKRKRESLDEEIETQAEVPQYVQCTRNFTRTSGTIMNDVAAHKCASIFAKPITERDAPGYRDLIYRPQDIKSIKSAIHQGSKAVAAALEASDEESTAGNGLLLRRTADLIPPKSIINSAQLEMELIRMFANAIMFNPTPEATFGPSFPMRREVLNEKGNRGSRESTDPMEVDEPFQEGGIITDTLDMFEDVETAVKRWRAAERAVAGDDAITMVSGGGSASGGPSSASAVVSKLRRGSVADSTANVGDSMDER